MTAAKSKLPDIEVQSHALERMTKQGDAALTASGLEVYQRYGELVRVREDERLMVEPIPAPQLLLALSKSARWFRWIPGKKTNDPPEQDLVPPPDKVVAIVQTLGEWKLRELLRVIDAPTVRPDGTVLQDPGYDLVTRTIYQPRFKFPRVADQPTHDDALAALDKIHWPVHEFPWKHGTDFATFVSLLLTAIGRPSIEGPTPLFAISATDRSIGKSKLAQVVARILTGADAGVMTYEDNHEEEKKTMLSLGMASTPLALMDNVDIPLGGAVLAACLTSTTYQARELGVSGIRKVPVPILVATGVNLKCKDDLGRRVLPIDLDPPTPGWKDRTFVIRDLERWTLDNRADLVHAALTILRAYHVAGRPTAAALKPYASYESWSEQVRGAVTWLGLPDPVLGNERFTASNDLDRDAALGFLQIWHDRYGPTGSTISAALELARTRDSELLEAMLLLDPKCNPERFDSRRASVQFQRVQGRFVGGYRLDPTQKTKRGTVWRVVTTSHLASPNVTPHRHLVNPFLNGGSHTKGDAVTRFSTSIAADSVPSGESHGQGREALQPRIHGDLLDLIDESESGYTGDANLIRDKFGESPRHASGSNGVGSYGSGGDSWPEHASPFEGGRGGPAVGEGSDFTEEPWDPERE